VAYADQFDDYEVVPACSIEAPLALIPVQLAQQNQALTIAISFDHVRKCYMFESCMKLLMSECLKTGNEPDELQDDDDQDWEGGPDRY
jgi:hypothetical protein